MIKDLLLVVILKIIVKVGVIFGHKKKNQMVNIKLIVIDFKKKIILKLNLKVLLLVKVK